MPVNKSQKEKNGNSEWQLNIGGLGKSPVAVILLRKTRRTSRTTRKSEAEGTEGKLRKKKGLKGEKITGKCTEGSCWRLIKDSGKTVISCYKGV